MKGLLLFLTGATLGSVITYKLVERKFKKIADEEIESVKEVFKNRTSLRVVKDDNTKVETESKTTKNFEIFDTSHNRDKVDYSKIIKSEGYDEDDYTVNCNDDPEEHSSPYIIEPEEFGTIEHYGTKTLTYYTDDVLVDEIDQIIKDRDIVIGPDTLDHMGEYEDDAIHVRDVVNEMDYEILQSELAFNKKI